MVLRISSQVSADPDIGTFEIELTIGQNKRMREGTKHAQEFLQFTLNLHSIYGNKTMGGRNGLL